jgi:hypothetical protein
VSTLLPPQLGPLVKITKAKAAETVKVAITQSDDERHGWQNQNHQWQQQGMSEGVTQATVALQVEAACLTRITTSFIRCLLLHYSRHKTQVALLMSVHRQIGIVTFVSPMHWEEEEEMMINSDDRRQQQHISSLSESISFLFFSQTT